MTPFTLEPTGTVPKLVRMGLAFILELLEPLSVPFFGPLKERLRLEPFRSVPVQRGRSKRKRSKRERIRIER